MSAHLSTPPNLVAKSCFLFSATIFGECGVGGNGKEFWIQKHELCVASQGLDDTLIFNYKNSSTNKKELLCEL